MGNNSCSLTPRELGDLENSTAFNADEIRQYYQQFTKTMSKDQNSLTREQFQEAYAKIFPQGDSAQFADFAFNNFDKDNDGTIDFREFLSAVSVQQRGTPEEKLKWTFDLYDLDNSGFISKVELLKMVKSVYSLHGKRLAVHGKVTAQQLADYILTRSDSNDDGQLSRQEFVDGAMENDTIRKLLLGTLAATNITDKRK